MLTWKHVHAYTRAHNLLPSRQMLATAFWVEHAAGSYKLWNGSKCAFLSSAGILPLPMKRFRI